MFLKEGKGSGYVTAWWSKGLFKTYFYLSHDAFLPKVKQFGYKIGIKFNSSPLVTDKNNYAIKIVTLSMI